MAAAEAAVVVAAVAAVIDPRTVDLSEEGGNPLSGKRRMEMSSSVQIQYVGFKAKPTLREYTFVVKSGAESSFEYKLTIANDAFLARRVRYQDGPDICAHRVQRELDASNNQPEKTRCVISEAELESYRAAHSPRARTGMAYKPSREPF